MAKTARTTTRRTAPVRESVTLPRLEDSKNFAKFGLDIERGTIAPFGKVYLPLEDAVGVTSVTLTFNRNGR